MGKKEFVYGVLTSIVAAFVIEFSGIFKLSEYLSVKIDTPIWSLALFVTLPALLSVIWFRKTITPSHADLSTKFNELEEKKVAIENTLTESRSHASSLEVVISSTNTQLEKVRDELSDWEARGIKLWQEGEELEQIVNHNFGPEIVELDGKVFTGCRFEGSILKCKGTGPIKLNHCTFSDVRWVMDKPASEALLILGEMYASGIPEMIQIVEKTFENIRKKSGPESKARHPVNSGPVESKH